MRPSHLAIILDLEFRNAAHKQHTPVMIWGPPGVGKSQLVAQLARKNQAPVIDIRLSQMEPSDLRGIPFRRDDYVEWAPPAMLPNEKRHGVSGILFLDEITSAAPSVSAAAYQLLLDRRLGDYCLPDRWVIFAAGNREGDRGVTYTMPSPLANRFSHFELEVNLDDWAVWAFREQLDERIIGFLRFRPDLLFDFDPAKNPVAFPTPRSWEFADRALKKFSDQPEVLLPSLQACVGLAAGTEVYAFISAADKIPDLKAVLRGEITEVPREVDLQYALASALVGQALRVKDTDEAVSVYDHILEYAHYFPHKEMAVMMVSDMHRVIGQPLFDAPKFSKWANSISDLVLS